MQSVNPAVMQVFEVMGLTAFSISGAIAAYRRDLDIIGYIAVGVITGIGGGTIRDVILDRPVFWLNDPYLYSLNICIAASIFTYIVSKFMSYHEKTVNWFDAVGLALFAVQGYSMAYAFFEHREVAVVMGVIRALRLGRHNRPDFHGLSGQRDNRFLHNLCPARARHTLPHFAQARHRIVNFARI